MCLLNVGSYWQVYYWKEDPQIEEQKVLSFGRNKTQGKLRGLQPYSLYTFNVRAFNEKGEGPPSPNQQFNTPEGGGSAQPPNLGTCVITWVGRSIAGVTLSTCMIRCATALRLLTLLFLAHVKVPGPPASLRITNPSLDSLTVEWGPPVELNGQLTGYTLRYQPSQSSLHFMFLIQV